MSQYFDNDKNIKSERKIIKFNFNNKDFSIYSDNGVFSKDRFDYGTRVLLNSVDIDKLSGNVLDLGCGLGVVGIILGTFNKGINIDMVDINERAIDLAKNNLVLNNVKANVFVSDIYSNIDNNYSISKTNIQAGDVITKVNNKKITSYEQLSIELAVNNGKKINLTVKNKDGEETYTIEPTLIESEGQTNYIYGFSLSNEKEKGILKSIEYAFQKTGALTNQMVLIVKYLVTGKLSLNNLSGPVGIYQIVDQARTLGFLNILYLIAYLCINVGFINFIPFPAFDGGRILFLIIEKIKGSKVNPKVENTIHSIGFALLMLLMVFVTYNDIIRIFG